MPQTTVANSYELHSKELADLAYMFLEYKDLGSRLWPDDGRKGLGITTQYEE